VQPQQSTEQVLLQRENALLRERCKILEDWAKRTMSGQLRWASKHQAALIIGKGGRHKVQQIDAGIKDTTRAENAKIRIDLHKVFEDMTKIRYNEL